MNFSRLHGKSQARKVLPWASSGFLGFQIEGKNWRRERCHGSSLATLVLAHSIITPKPLCHPSLVAPIHGFGFARILIFSQLICHCIYLLKNVFNKLLRTGLSSASSLETTDGFPNFLDHSGSIKLYKTDGSSAVSPILPLFFDLWTSRKRSKWSLCGR
ncbi:hypothetical protein AMTRI_Chr09g31630 [Amborella trichopoda]